MSTITNLWTSHKFEQHFNPFWAAKCHLAVSYMYMSLSLLHNSQIKQCSTTFKSTVQLFLTLCMWCKLETGYTRELRYCVSYSCKRHSSVQQMSHEVVFWYAHVTNGYCSTWYYYLGACDITHIYTLSLSRKVQEMPSSPWNQWLEHLPL